MEKLKQPKSLIWYVKLIIGSCAVAFGLFLLAGIVALPFVGFRFLQCQMTDDGGNAMSILTLLVSPFVYQRLK